MEVNDPNMQMKDVVLPGTSLSPPTSSEMDADHGDVDDSTKVHNIRCHPAW
jgi:hypothetical protein